MVRYVETMISGETRVDAGFRIISERDLFTLNEKITINGEEYVVFARLTPKKWKKEYIFDLIKNG